MSIAIVGCTVVDLVFSGLTRLPAWPRHGEFTRSNLVFLRKPPIVTLGGNGANAAYAAASCGATVVLHTQVGKDWLGGLARQWLGQAGCRVEAGGKGATGVNVTAANLRHQRATFFHPGAAVAMPAISSGKRSLSHLLVCGWPHPPLARIARSLRAARRNSIFTALDAGPILGRPWTLSSLRGVFSVLDLFIANEYEIRRIAKSAALTEAIGRLRQSFPGHVVIKRGPKGALWIPAGSNRAHAVPGSRVRTVNTVGAGDSFNGALLAALARGSDWPAALRTARDTSARVVASRRGVLGIC